MDAVRTSTRTCTKINLSKMYNPRTDIKEVWCGTGPRPRDYARTGTRSECLRMGYGAGAAAGRCRGVEDLNHLPYVTPRITRTLRDNDITTVTDFLTFVMRLDYRETKELIRSIYGRECDAKTFNSMCRYLYKNRVPIQCIPATIRP